MSWLEGGPFLEVSFVMLLETDRQSFVDMLFTKLKSFNPPIEFATSDYELHEMLTEFNKGYPYDEEDPNTIFYHQAKIPVFIDINGKRKSVLSIEQISQQLIEVDFWFYGDESDAPEWGQRGIPESEVHLYKEMLHALFETFNFPIGTVGYENSVVFVFDTSDFWPDDKYNLENIKTNLLQIDNYFVLIIANRNKVNLQGIEGFKLTHNKVIFEA